MGQKKLRGQHLCTKTVSSTLTFDHVTLKSIGSIYSLRVSTKPSLGTFKQKSQAKRTLLGLQTDRQVHNNMPPFFKGGHKNGMHMVDILLAIWYRVYKYCKFTFLLTFYNYSVCINRTSYRKSYTVI